MPSVTCQNTLHSELPYRGRMEWFFFIPFYPAGAIWNGKPIPDYLFPIPNCPTHYFPM